MPRVSGLAVVLFLQTPATEAAPLRQSRVYRGEYFGFLAWRWIYEA